MFIFRSRYFSKLKNSNFELDLEYFVVLFIKVIAKSNSVEAMIDCYTTVLYETTGLSPEIKMKLERYSFFDSLHELESSDYFKKNKIINDILTKINNLANDNRGVKDIVKNSLNEFVQTILIIQKKIRDEYIPSDNYEIDFFISYSSNDVEKIKPIVKKLSQNYKVWIDFYYLVADESYFTTQIYDAIEKSRFILMFLS